MSPRLFKVVLATLVFAIFMAETASAQSYLRDEVDTSLRIRGKIFVKRYVKSPTGSPEDEQQFRDYFTKYYFPAMTQPTSDALGQIGKMRADLFKQYLGAAKGNSRKFLIEESYDWAKKIVTKRNYHPSVTYNALLVLGRLDAPTDGTPKVECNTFLSKVVATAVKNERVSQYMLVGALEGLVRHAQLLDKLPQRNQVVTTRALAGVLMVKELAGRYEPEVRDWIYIKAASGLAATKSAGDNGRHFYAIARRAIDKSVSLESRIKIASMLNDLNAPSNLPKIDSIAKSINKLAVEWSTSEDEMATVFENLNLRGGGGALPRGRKKYDHRIQEGQDRSVEYLRAGLLANMTHLESALAAFKPMLKDPLLSQGAEIGTAIQNAQRIAANKDEIDLNVADAVKQMHRKIEEVVGPFEEPPKANPSEVAVAQ